MNRSNSPSRLSIAAALGMLIAFGNSMSGQEAAEATVLSNETSPGVG